MVANDSGDFKMKVAVPYFKDIYKVMILYNTLGFSR
jgi:hypothetical protein